MSEKQQRLVAVIFPQAGGYMARIMPPGIVCFSESLEGLEREIQEALDGYSADLDDMTHAENDFNPPAELAAWEEAVDASNVFYWDLDDRYPH